MSSTVFLAQLVNYQVVTELLAAQILLLLLQNPTDDSVEVAVELTKQVGAFLEEMSPAIANTVYDQFRTILHEGEIERRTQYMIEILFQTRKDKYKDYPPIKDELGLELIILLLVFLPFGVIFEDIEAILDVNFVG